MEKNISFKDIKDKYVFICDELSNMPSAWNFCVVNDITKAPSFMCYNSSFDYAWYARYAIPFADFNPYNMEETLKHVIDAAHVQNN